MYQSARHAQAPAAPVFGGGGRAAGSPAQQGPGTVAAGGDLYKVPELPAKLRCSLSAVYNLIAQGKLRAIRVGTRKGYRVSQQALDDFLRQAEGEPPQPEGPLKHIR